MTELFIAVITKSCSLISLVTLYTYKMFDLLFNVFNWADNILYNLSLKSDILWYFYEKFFFYFQNRSFNYYSRIMWKPSLNISDHIFNVPIFFVIQTMFIVIMSVWARAVGPRVRMDQLSHLVWKDFVPSLTLVLLAILIIMVF